MLAEVGLGLPSRVAPSRSGFALQGRAPRRTGDPISWSNVKLSLLLLFLDNFVVEYQAIIVIIISGQEWFYNGICKNRNDIYNLCFLSLMSCSDGMYLS
jgi:hypothetical protein